MNSSENGLKQRLRSARNAKGLSPKQLAELAGVSYDTIRKIEDGTIKKPREIAAIAKPLDVTPAWLQFGIEQIDELDEDSIELALLYKQLPESQKLAIKTTIDQLTQKTKKES